MTTEIKHNKHNSGIWEYLEGIGILEHGTEEQIKAAKRSYWKIYFTKYKRKQREHKPEYNVCFSKENGEWSRVEEQAKRHNRTITAFIRLATLAYIEKTFVVPNTEQIIKLEQLLSDCLNEIQTIVRFKKKYSWERDRKLEVIEKRIEKLETEIHEVFCNPPLSNNNPQITNHNNAERSEVPIFSGTTECL